MELVITKLEAGIGTLTLNHPKKLNSINAQLVDEVNEAFDAMEQANAQVVVLRALPGAKVWSSGHDITELPERRRNPLAFHDPVETLVRRVQDFPVPVIAMVEGSVWGGGCDVCLACDIIVCTDDATFAIKTAQIGVPYNSTGLVRFLQVVGPQKAKEMFFTAQPISARDALSYGMVNHVVGHGELEAVTYGIAEKIMQNAPLAVRVLKQQFRLLLHGQVLSTEVFESIEGMRRLVYDSYDYEEGIQAFKEKRKPKFSGQ